MIFVFTRFTTDTDATAWLANAGINGVSADDIVGKYVLVDRLDRYPTLGAHDRYTGPVLCITGDKTLVRKKVSGIVAGRFMYANSEELV